MTLVNKVDSTVIKLMCKQIYLLIVIVIGKRMKGSSMHLVES